MQTENAYPKLHETLRKCNINQLAEILRSVVEGTAADAAGTLATRKKPTETDSLSSGMTCQFDFSPTAGSPCVKQPSGSMGTDGTSQLIFSVMFVQKEGVVVYSTMHWGLPSPSSFIAL